MYRWISVAVILSLITALQALNCSDLLPGQYYCADARYFQAQCNVKNRLTGEEFVEQQRNAFLYSPMRHSVRYRVRRRRKWHFSEANQLHKPAKRHKLAYGAPAVDLSRLGGH